MKKIYPILVFFLSSCFYDPITGIDYLMVNNLNDKLTIKVIPNNTNKDSLSVHEIPPGQSKIVLKDYRRNMQLIIIKHGWKLLRSLRFL
ncbi:hypothetical protein [Sporocytophaga myxococcoides]|uniref:hypothetical protein n=1 Tax=Sporocytophaga myxococcoides TaxID=153721 RepID=UPI0012E08E67|nr:hypothetical protein [Sporocytophaga myxococcoides]